MHTHIIYIYICVCVCVCVCINMYKDIWMGAKSNQSNKMTQSFIYDGTKT